MANKVKIKNEQGTQVFPITHVSAVLDNNGNSVEQVLGAQTDLIQQAQLEIGAVPSDLTPTAGSSNWVTSGGVFSSLSVDSAIDLSAFETKNCCLGGSKKWYVSSQGAGKHKAIPVTAGEMYVLVSAAVGEEYGGTYGWLTSSYNGSASDGATVPYVSGTDRIQADYNTRIELVVPDGAAYLCLTTVNGGGVSIESTLFKMISVKEKTSNDDTVPTPNSNKYVISGGVYDFIDDIIGLGVAIDLSQYTEQNCSLGNPTWYNAGSQKHIAIPVSAGDKYKLKPVNYGGNVSPSNNGWYVFVTNAYSPPYTSGGTIPYVGNASRISLPIGSSIGLTVPATAAYLILTVVDGAGVRVAWSLMKEGVVDSQTVSDKLNALNETVDNINIVVNGAQDENIPFNEGVLTTTAVVARYYAYAKRSVRTGDKVTIRLNDYTNYKVGISINKAAEWTAESVFDTGWKQEDIVLTVPEVGSGYYLRYAIGRVANESITLAQGEGAISELSLISSGGGLVEKIDSLASHCERIPMKVLGTSTYAGKKIDVAEHSYSYSNIGTLTSVGQYRQGFAVFGDYLFQCHNTNSAIVIFKLSTGTNIQTLSLTADADNHANNAGFGSQYYNENDPFPVLYVSSQGQSKLYAYRITGTDGNYSISLVQTISFNVGYYYANVNIDATNERGVIVGYSQNTWQSATSNQMFCCCFDLPALSEGDVTISSFYNEFNFPFIYAAQGGVGKYGKLYVSFGNTSGGLNIGGILVIDYILHNVESFLDLKAVGNFEPEGVALWDDGMVITTHAGSIYKLTF